MTNEPICLTNMGVHAGFNKIKDLKIAQFWLTKLTHNFTRQ